MIVTLNHQNNTVLLFTTKSGAGKYYNLSYFQVDQRIKSGKIDKNSIQFMQVEPIKDKNKRR